MIMHDPQKVILVLQCPFIFLTHGRTPILLLLLRSILDFTNFSKRTQYVEVEFIHMQICPIYLWNRYNIFKHVFVYTHLASIPLAEPWSEHSEILCMSFQLENLPSQDPQLAAQMIWSKILQKRNDRLL